MVAPQGLGENVSRDVLIGRPCAWVICSPESLIAEIGYIHTLINLSMPFTTFICHSEEEEQVDIHTARFFGMCPFHLYFYILLQNHQLTKIR